MSIYPVPTPEEAAAIAAALRVARQDEERPPPPGRWELAGRLGRSLPAGVRLPESVWGWRWWDV